MSRAKAQSARPAVGTGDPPGAPPGEPDHAMDLLRARRRAEQDTGPPFLLMGLLEIAVPMWIEQVRAMPDPVRDRRRLRCLELIAYEKTGPDDSTDRADIAGLATGSTPSRPGLIAAGFNALAEGLAHLAFCPGGVTWCGSHWDAKWYEARRRELLDRDCARVDLIHVLRGRAEGVR